MTIEERRASLEATGWVFSERTSESDCEVTAKNGERCVIVSAGERDIVWHVLFREIGGKQ